MFYNTYIQTQTSSLDLHIVFDMLIEGDPIVDVALKPLFED